MRRWRLKGLPEGEDGSFDSKKAADRFCRAWVQEHPGSELILLRRKDLRPTTKYRSVDGQVVAEKLHRRAGAGRPSKHKPRCVAELIDLQLQNQLGLTAREAARAREVLVDLWKEGLHAEGLAWTPAGDIYVANQPRVQRARNSEFAERRKLWQRKVKIKFKANPKYFPEPKKTEYTYRQFGLAKQLGLIEERPRPEPLSPLASVMRQTSGKPKPTPPRRPRRRIAGLPPLGRLR